MENSLEQAKIILYTNRQTNKTKKKSTKSKQECINNIYSVCGGCLHTAHLLVKYLLGEIFQMDIETLNIGPISFNSVECHSSYFLFDYFVVFLYVFLFRFVYFSQCAFNDRSIFVYFSFISIFTDDTSFNEFISPGMDATLSHTDLHMIHS